MAQHDSITAVQEWDNPQSYRSVMKPSPQHMAPFQLCPEPSMKNSVEGLICSHNHSAHSVSILTCSARCTDQVHAEKAASLHVAGLAVWGMPMRIRCKQRKY